MGQDFDNLFAYLHEVFILEKNNPMPVPGLSNPFISSLFLFKQICQLAILSVWLSDRKNVVESFWTVVGLPLSDLARTLV